MLHITVSAAIELALYVIWLHKVICIDSRKDRIMKPCFHIEMKMLHFIVSAATKQALLQSGLNLVA
eukprot:1161896-Pelagomonas_calceolata.AAC.2